MQLIDPRTGIEMLDRDACLDLLAADEIGRLGVVTHGAPRIFPVNYVLDGDTIVIRTAHGTKLDDGIRAPACFEIDALDRQTHTGWSVLVNGNLEEVTPLQHQLWTRLSALPLAPWAHYRKDHIVRLVPTHIGGRRVT